MTVKRYDLEDDPAGPYLRLATRGRWVEFAELDAIRAAALRVLVSILAETEHLPVPQARVRATEMLEAELADSRRA